MHASPKFGWACFRVDREFEQKRKVGDRLKRIPSLVASRDATPLARSDLTHTPLATLSQCPLTKLPATMPQPPQPLSLAHTQSLLLHLQSASNPLSPRPEPRTSPPEASSNVQVNRSSCSALFKTAWDLFLLARDLDKQPTSRCRFLSRREFPSPSLFPGRKAQAEPEL